MRITYTDELRIELALSTISGGGNVVRCGMLGAAWRVVAVEGGPQRLAMDLEALDAHALDPRLMPPELPLPNEVELSTTGEIELPVSDLLQSKITGQ